MVDFFYGLPVWAATVLILGISLSVGLASSFGFARSFDFNRQKTTGTMRSV